MAWWELRGSLWASRRSSTVTPTAMLFSVSPTAATMEHWAWAGGQTSCINRWNLRLGLKHCPAGAVSVWLLWNLLSRVQGVRVQIFAFVMSVCLLWNLLSRVQGVRVQIFAFVMSVCLLWNLPSCVQGSQAPMLGSASFSSNPRVNRNPQVSAGSADWGLWDVQKLG